MRFTRTTVVVFAVVSCFFTAFIPTAPAQQTAVSVQQAVKEGLVDVKVSSLGGATGNTVRVDVRRKAPKNVQVEITPGTVFLSGSNDVQNMAGGKVKGEFVGPNTYRPTDVNVMVLNDDAWHGYLIESYCMDFHKGPPRRGFQFQLAIQDQRTSRILDAAKDPSASLWARQFALWIDRDGISEKELLSRYGNVATEVDVRVAKKLTEEAEQAGVKSIPADMPANVRVEVKKLFSPDPAQRAAAVKVLVNMGNQAEAAAPLLADNVVTPTPGQADRSTWLTIPTNPEETSVMLEQIGVPDLKALLDAVRQRRDARDAENQDKKSTDRPRPLRDIIQNRINATPDAKEE